MQQNRVKACAAPEGTAQYRLVTPAHVTEKCGGAVDCLSSRTGSHACRGCACEVGSSDGKRLLVRWRLRARSQLPSCRLSPAENHYANEEPQAKIESDYNDVAESSVNDGRQEPGGGGVGGGCSRCGQQVGRCVGRRRRRKLRKGGKHTLRYVKIIRPNNWRLANTAVTRSAETVLVATCSGGRDKPQMRLAVNVRYGAFKRL